ncbi:MAG: Coenzyme F420 hydrogenase/dehydrogenase, beta subunit C-terminal domain [Chloroflexota bacterium]|nr:Coenzyme F420 hydrogenase/dehydrogenase, beta subunit C-terminal domain [Chloroflexota bacterium]
MSGFAIRSKMNDIDEAPGKVWFWELEQAVIDPGRCVQCGTCVAACPSDSIGIGTDNLPKLVKMCTGCSLCWDFCPRGGLRYEASWKLIAEDHGASGLGVIHESHTARVRTGVPGRQDGGVVSAILIALLESGELDGALVARESATEPWKGEAYLARTPEEVLECAGSFYNQTMALGHLDLKRYDLPPDARIAVVGTPCEIEGIKAMQARPWIWGASRVDAVTLTIALLCTKSFNYEQLMLQEIQRKRGIDLASVGKVDVIRGKMLVYDRQGNTLVDESVRDFHGAALKGCDECADFLGRTADISVGSVGSADGYSSVLIRSQAGLRAFDRVRHQLELRELDKPEGLEKLDALDKKVAFRSLQRPFNPEGPLFIDYEEHLQHYAGTDRAPVEHDAVRY